MQVSVLEGRVAIVTGAASGLGRASARALATAGARIVLADLDAEGLDETKAIVEKLGSQAICCQGDVSILGDVDRMIESAVTRFGRLDILHANAGVEKYAELEIMAEADLDRVLEVDLKGVLLCARQAIAPMKFQGGGSLIFTSSVQASHSLPGCVVYAAAKAGVIAAARTLAIEVGKFGIRVNAISPGTIDTPMLRRDLADMDLDQADGFLDRVKAANALGRIGLDSEIGSAVVFLASDAASYITATNLTVDGGFTAVKAF